jgi:hypothetical protein
VIKIHSAPHPLVLENLRNVLELEGIASEVKTPFLGAARGDIPSTECWAELWVLDDGEADRASRIIRSALEPYDGGGATWKCGKCGEESEQQFGACWQCGTARSDAEA